MMEPLSQEPVFAWGMESRLQPEWRSRWARRLACLFLAAGLSGMALNPAVAAPGIFIERSGPAMVVTVAWTPGASLRVERTATLGGGVWEFVSIGDADGTGRYSITNLVTDPVRFYRGAISTNAFYTSNVVGVVNRVVPPNGDYLGNPLVATDPSVGALLGATANGISLFKIRSDGSYHASTYVNGWSDPGLTLRPGEAFFVRNPTASPVTLSFFGDVLQGTSTIHLPSGWVLCTSTHPVSGSLGTLNYPANDGDLVYFWNPALDSFGEGFLYIDGLGWLDSGTGEPADLYLAAGQAFWTMRALAGNWVRSAGGSGTYEITAYAPSAGDAELNLTTYNAAGPGYGRVLDVDGLTPVGPGFRGQLYAGSNGVESSFVPVGTPSAFGTASAAGYLNRGLVAIPGQPPGATVHFQLRAWHAADGDTYEAAVAASGNSGRSNVESLVTPDGTPAQYPPDVNTFPTFSLTLYDGPPVPPFIQFQPQDQFATAGSSPAFDVRAAGTAPLSYQWYYNGTNAIPAPSSPRLTLPFVSLASAGTYHVVVSNPHGVVASEGASLTVALCESAPPGMVGWWPGNGHTRDLMGGKDATLMNGAGHISGIVNQGFRFDGVDDHAVIPHAAVSNLAGSFTFEMWIRPNSLANSPMLFEKGNVPSNRIGLRATSTGNLGGYFDTSFYSALSGAGALGAGRWSHVAFVLDDPANQVRVYVDGVLAGSGTDTRVPTGNTQPLLLATAGVGGGFSFDGLIDEFAFYDRALSDAELGALFQKGPAGRCGTISVPLLLAPIASQTVAVGSNATFFAYATGLPNPVYQWRRNGVNLIGATGSSLVISNAQLADAGAYSVVVSNSFGSVASPPADLTVTSPPFITSHPQGTVVLPDATVILTVSAVGTAPLSYQWQFEGVDIPGATGASLVLSPISSLQSGGYRARVTNSLGSVLSEFAMVLVLQPPKILSPPVPVTVLFFDPFTLCVDAGGSGPLQFQWRKNGINIPGATNACYAVESAAAADGGSYSVLVANEVGLDSSEAVSVVIELEQLVAGDDFEQRVLLESSTVRASNVGATKEDGEPDHAGQPGGRSVWYRRVAGVNGIATVRTSGSVFDTLLAVYKGSSVDSLALVATDEDDGGFFASEVSFNVTEGTEYQIVVDGFDGASGNFVITWQLEPTPDPLPQFLELSPSQTVPPGGAAEFRVTATGGELSYEWLFNGAPMPGETASNLKLSGVTAAQVGQYVVRVGNEFNRFVVSPPMLLEIGTVGNVQSADKISNPTPMANTNLLTGGKLGGVTGSIAPGSFILVGAGTTGSQILNTTNSLRQPGEPNHCNRLGSATRWIVLRAAVSGLQLQLDTEGSLIETVLAVYTRNSILEPLVEVACSSGSGSIAGIQFAASAAVDYWVAVDGVNGAQGVIQLNWGLGLPPSVMLAPPAEDAVLGEEITWSLSLASGTPPPWIQWRFQGGDIADANGIALALKRVAAEDAGEYSVVVSNALGMVEQSVASLTVDLTQEAAVQHDFETGPEDWLVLGVGVTNPPVHQPTGGASGGYVSHSDGSDPTVGYFQGPATFLGNQSAAYGGRLKFNLTRSAAPAGAAAPGVVLVTWSGVLVYGFTSDPGAAWTTYDVLLHESAGWRKDDLDGPIPSHDEMLRMLSRVERWLIRADYSPQPHSTGLDNVRVIRPTQTEVAQMTATVLPGGEVLLEWPAAASGFQVETTFQPGQGSVWDPVQIAPTMGDHGLMWIQVSGGEGQFFRLRKQ